MGEQRHIFIRVLVAGSDKRQQTPPDSTGPRRAFGAIAIQIARQTSQLHTARLLKNSTVAGAVVFASATGVNDAGIDRQQLPPPQL